MPVWRALLAGLVIVGLGAGLVYAIAVTGDGENPTPTLATAPSLTVAPTVGATVTLPVAQTTSTTVPSHIVTSTSFSTPPVVVALRDALASWGQFAVTGKMRDLGDHFVVGGPQRRLLRAESTIIQADPPGLPAYVVTTDNIFIVSVTPTDIVLHTEIQWAREGEETQFFVWDVQMQLVADQWQLLTIEEVPSG